MSEESTANRKEAEERWGREVGGAAGFKESTKRSTSYVSVWVRVCMAGEGGEVAWEWMVLRNDTTMLLRVGLGEEKRTLTNATEVGET